MLSFLAFATSHDRACEHSTEAESCIMTPLEMPTQWATTVRYKFLVLLPYTLMISIATPHSIYCLVISS